MVVSIDGQIVAPEDAVVSVFDRGFLYGDGVFEVLRTWDGVAVDLDAHLARLYGSASTLALRAIERSVLAGHVRDAVAAAGPGDVRVRIVLTRGAGSSRARFAELPVGRAIVIVEPLPAVRQSVSLAVVDWPIARRTVAAHKSLAFLDHLIARELAIQAGADEAVRLGADDEVVECAMANLFVVVAGEVRTPPLAGILPGITRARVLATCHADGIAAREILITLSDLESADEVFVTSSIQGVVPVTAIDGEPRSTGAVTARVRNGFVQRIRAPLVAVPAI